VTKIRQVMVDGKPQDVIEVPFEIVKEPWAEYEMLDGGHLRVRYVLQRLFVQVDSEGTPMTDDQGDPKVVVQAQPVSVVATK
jgi:hypothetical protein